MPIFDYQGTDGREAIDEAYKLAIYSNIDENPVTPPGWVELTAAELGIDPSLVDANGFFTDDGSINDGTAKVLAKVDADGNITEIAVSFTGTNSAPDLSDYGALVDKSYDNAFDYLFQAVQEFTVAQGLDGSDVLFTGYSLGGGAANLAAEESAMRLGGFFASSDYFGFSSPVIAEGENVFNFGFENDAVFRIAGGADAPSEPRGLIGNDNEYATSTDNLIYFNDDYADPNFPNGLFSFYNREAWSAHTESVSIDPTPIMKVAGSHFYDYMEQDSTIILSGLSDELRATTWVEPLDRRIGGDHTGDTAFVLGSDLNDLLGDANGSDFLDGFAGDDMFRIGGGNDSVNGGEGADRVELGGALADYEFVRLDDGTVYVLDTTGASGLDELVDVEMIDTRDLRGLALTGDGVVSEGVVVASYQAAVEGTDASETLTGGGWIFGGAGDDTLAGDLGGDLLHGGDGGDSLSGGAGDDQLFGAAGGDLIDGGSGDDILSSGVGDDYFVFGPGSGHDTITDYDMGEQGHDTIAFAAGLFADFSTMTAAAEQVGDDVVISYGADSLTLQHVALASLDAQDFLFS